jgi:hypothetical protein
VQQISGSTGAAATSDEVTKSQKTRNCAAAPHEGDPLIGMLAASVRKFTVAYCTQC